MKIRGRLWTPSIRIKKLLALAGVVGPILSLVLTLTTHLLQPHYDHIRHSISSLIFGPWGWLQTVSFLTFGILMVAFDIGLYFGVRRSGGFRTGMIILLLASLGMVVVGVFPTDGPGAEGTLNGRIHFEAARMAALFFLIALFLITPSLRRDPRWKPVANYTLATAIIAFGLEIARVELIEEDSSWGGLHERILVANGLIWTEVMAIRLFMLFSREGRKAPQTAENR